MEYWKFLGKVDFIFTIDRSLILFLLEEFVFVFLSLCISNILMPDFPLGQRTFPAALCTTYCLLHTEWDGWGERGGGGGEIERKRGKKTVLKDFFYHQRTVPDVSITLWFSSTRIGLLTYLKNNGFTELKWHPINQVYLRNKNWWVLKFLCKKRTNYFLKKFFEKAKILKVD